MKIILIMGLPGSGKTTLANEIAPSLDAKRLNAENLVPLINAKWINADEVRKAADDWDFSEEGRKRQAKRMADFAKKLNKMAIMWLQILFVQHLLLESYLMRTTLSGLTQ